MCGIAGFWDAKASERIVQALAELAVRGQDAAGVITSEQTMPTIVDTPSELPRLANSSSAMGHTLHAMVGFLPQPLVSGLRGRLVANCELYSWRARAEQEGIRARNDADLLLALLDKLPVLNGPSIVALVDSLSSAEYAGTFAFIYERDGMVIAARDRFGVKPLWYSTANGLAIASTAAALRAAGIVRISELSPRSCLLFDSKTKELALHHREFLAQPTIGTIAALDVNESQAELVAETGEDSLVLELAERVQRAILIRVPENTQTRSALFIGGGVDSAVLAFVLGSLSKDKHPQCYTVARHGSKEARAGAAIAAVAGLPWKLVPVTATTVSSVIPVVQASSDDANPVKISVGIVTALASEAAAKDGCLCAFSGIGVDETFATLARHQASTDKVLEAIASLRKLHERELTRDDAIAMSYGVELRLPFLDEAVVICALRTLRTNLDQPAGNKNALRKAAEKLGVPEIIAELPRKAPQYGSGVMQALVLLAKRAGASSVAEYTAQRSLLNGKAADSLGERDFSIAATQIAAKRVAVLLSGGKDSVLAAHIMCDMKYSLACAVTIASDNPDSYLYHTPNIAAAALQAQAMRLPFITARTHGEPELELSALREALLKAKEEYAIGGVVTGAIGSHYQRERIEKLCDELSLTVYSPLWQMDQLAELRMLLERGFAILFTRVAAEGLDFSWLGTRLTHARIVQLAQLRDKYGVHPAGEGGEYESLVLDAPLFHERIEIGRTEVIKDGSAGTLHVYDLSLVPK